MILVTVGTARQPFTRLLEAADALAASAEFSGESFLLQVGHAASSGFRARHCEQTDFFTRDQFSGCVADADVVVCHAGAGTLIEVIRAGKIPVAMARLQRYGEHVDDHQLELVAELAAVGRVIPVREVGDLAAAIREARRRNVDGSGPPHPPIVERVRRAIVDLVGPADGRAGQAG